MAKITNRQVIINLHTTTGTTAPAADKLELGEIVVQNTATEPAIYTLSGESAVAKFENSTVVSGHIADAKSELIGTDKSASSTDTIKGSKKYTDEKVAEVAGTSLTGVSVNGSAVTVTDKVAVVGDVVTTFGTKKGAITLLDNQSENGKVNLTMNENRLEASIVGLGDAAFSAGTAFDAAGEADKALSAATAYTKAEIEKLDADEEGTSNDITVKVTEVDGKINSVTVTAPDMLTGVTSGNKAIAVGTKADHSQSISLTVDSEDKVLSVDEAKGLKSTIGMYYDSANTNIVLTGNGGTAISTIDASEFIKDGMLWGQKVFTAEATEQKVTITKGTGSTAVTQEYTFSSLTVGNTYIALCFINYGKQTTYTWDKIDVTKLIDAYYAGNGLSLDSTTKTFSIKLADGNETFLTVDENGLKLSGVQTAINAGRDAATAYTDEKIDALDASVVNTAADAGTDASTQIKVQVGEEDGKLTGVTVTAPKFDLDGAAASALTDAKAYSDEKTINEQSGHTITLYGTDIKINSTTASSITEVILSNERVTAAAINELETNKVDKVSGKELIATTAITKLEGIETGAQVNVLEGVQVNGSDLSVTSKKVNVTVTTGSANGTIAVNGSDIAVKGLGSAAYVTEESLKTYADTTAATAESNAMAYADDKIAALDVTVSGENTSKQIKVEVVETDGKLTSVAVTADKFDVDGAAATAESNAKAYADTTAATAESNAKAYADTTAATAESNAKTYANGLKTTIDAYTVNGTAISTNPVLDGADIKLDDYTKASSSAAIATTDTVNAALGKLEYKIDTASSGALESVAAGDGISVTEKTNKSQTISAKIKSTEKILTATTDGLYTTLAIAYDGTSKQVQLKGLNNEVVSYFDATAFIKDGMLYGQQVFKATATTMTITIKEQSHEFTDLTVGQAYLAMCFANQEYTGETPAVTYSWDKINVSSLIDVYTAGNGLQLSDGQFSIKVNTTDNEFLEVSDNGIRVTGVSSAIDTKISTAIADLDATKSGSNNGVTVEVTETDGKITNVAVIGVDVDSKISTAIAGLDASVVNTAADAGSAASTQIKVKVDELDGKLTAVTVTAPKFDADGAAAQALIDATAYTDTAISGLDATVEQSATTSNGLSLQVVEENGKLTSVSGSIADGTYVDSVTLNGKSLKDAAGDVTFDALTGIKSGADAGVTATKTTSTGTYELDFSNLRIDAGEY